MDFSLSFASDWWNLISIPLIIITFRDVAAGWHSIWHEKLTDSSRMLLKRMAIFLLLPFIVLVHELGHLFAALQVGAQVLDFHYGPVTGHVTVRADRPPAEMLWIALAGNLVQIVVGLFVLLTAPLRKSPPAVALSVYFGLFTVADTTIFYAMLSIGGLYGDWIQIYSSPATGLVAVVVVGQVIINTFLAWCVLAPWPKRWFADRTNPEWAQECREIESFTKNSGTFDNFVTLAEVYARGGLYGEARKTIEKAEKLEPGNARLTYMRGRLALLEGKVEDCLKYFISLQDDESLSEVWRSRLCLEIGQLQAVRRDNARAVEAYDRACALDPQLGDARLGKAVMLNSMGKHIEALAALESVTPAFDWENMNGPQLLQQELAETRKTIEDKGK